MKNAKAVTAVTLGRALLVRAFSLPVNAFGILPGAKVNVIADLTKKLYYFTLFFTGRTRKGIAYCSTPLGHLLIPYEDGSFYYMREILVEEIYDKPWKDETFDLIIDVGAHVGIFTLKASKKGEKVLAFEPHPINYLLLVKNIELNTLSNVLTFKLAISDRAGIVDLYEGRFSGSASLKALPGRRKAGIKVKCDTLDNIVGQMNLDLSDMSVFLKVDVEGSEMEVLRGASYVLRSAKRMKVSCASYHYAGEILEVGRLLRKMGFRVFKSNNYIIYAERRNAD